MKVKSSKRQFRGKTRGVDMNIKVAPENQKNSFVFDIPDGGQIRVVGTGAFVTKVFRQLLEHPESLVGEELIKAYQDLSSAQQKRFRKNLQIGEFSDPEHEPWPAWL